MKRTKRILIPLLGLILALCMVFAVACNNGSQPEGEKYTVTVTCDETKGTATLSPVADDNKYEEGTSVTLTVAAKADYTVGDVTVNGTAVTLTENKYTFSVECDTAIVVTFDDASEPEELTDAVLATAQGKVTFEGMYTLTLADTGVWYSYMNTLITSFAENAIWVYEADGEDGAVYSDYVAVDRDGMLALAYHNAQNEMKYLSLDEPFSNSWNPFDALTAADFALVESGIYRLTDLEKAAAVAQCLSGYDENVTEFYLYTENGRVTGIYVGTSDNVLEASDGSVIFYDTEVSYELTDYGTGRIPEGALAPYTSNAEHAALAAALASAASATSYTVRRMETDGEVMLEYNIYVTENAVYADELTFGYFVRGGKVYPYSYDTAKQQAVIASEVDVDGLAEICATFGGFSSALFSFDSETNTYTLRGDFYINGITSGLAGVVASAFAELGTNRLEAYAADLEIVLDDEGALSEVNFIYVIINEYGYTEASGFVSLEYSDFGETTLPVDLSDAKTVFEAFVGTYVGKELDGTVYAIEITDMSILLSINGGNQIEGKDIVIEDMGDFLQIVLMFDDVEYYLLTGYGPRKDGFLLMNELLWDGPQVVLLPEGSEGPEVPTPYPFAFYGTFEVRVETTTDDGAPLTLVYKIVIDERGVTLTENGSDTFFAVADILYTTLDGLSLVFGEGDEIAYYFIVANEYSADGVVSEIAFHNDDNTFHLTLARTGAGTEPEKPFEMPDKYIGKFVGHNSYDGKDYVVDISAEGIKVKIGDADFVSVTFTYDAQSRNFYFELNGKNYVLMDMSEGAKDDYVNNLQLEDDDNYHDSVSLTRKEDGDDEDDSHVTIGDDHLGTYKGTGKDGKEYVIKLEKSKVIITVDGGTPETCYYLEKSSKDDIYFMWNDREYDVYFSDPIALWVNTPSMEMIVESLTLVPEDGDDEDDSHVTIGDDHLGTYKGTGTDGKEYVIKLEKSKVIITVDGGAPETCYYLEKSSKDDIYFMWNDREYDVYFSYSIALWVNTPSAAMIVESLTLVPEGGVTIPDKYCGKFKGTYGAKEYIFNISADGITATVDGAAAEITVLSADDSALVITLDGTTYTLRKNVYLSEISVYNGSIFLFDLNPYNE